MRICNNLSAMNTYRQYSINSTNVSRSVQKLSSGQRINCAADDSAGLAISEKMRAQIRGLNQASKNSQDGISLLQTAEGALNETHGILQRMRELAVQSSSDTNDGSVDRAALDQEFQQMKNEVNDIANQTQFNGIHLLKGMTGVPAVNATGLAAGITVSADNTASAGTINIAAVIPLPGVAGTGSANLYSDDNGLTSATATGSITAGSAYNGNYYVKASGSDMSAMAFSLVNKDSGATVASTGAMSVDAGNNATLDFGNYGKLDVTLGTSTNESLLGFYLDGTTLSILKYSISGGIDNVPSPAWDAGADVAGTGSANLVTIAPSGINSATAVSGSVAGGSQYNGTYYLKATGSDMLAMTFSLVDGGGATVASTGLTWVSAGDNKTLDFENYGKLDMAVDAGTNPFLLGLYCDGTPASVINYTISGGVDVSASATIGGQLVTDGDSSVTLATGVTMDISILDESDWASPEALNTALFGSTTGSASIGVTAGVTGLTIQTGANAGDTLNITIGAMDATTLEIGSSDVTSRNNASTAITTVNTAINKVSTQRADLGAYQNRLMHKISNLDTSSENLQAAESRIRDADIAQEMTEYTKNNILVQAATAMLAQANSAPQNVLKLLQ